MSPDKPLHLLKSNPLHSKSKAKFTHSSRFAQMIGLLEFLEQFSHFGGLRPCCKKYVCKTEVGIDMNSRASLSSILIKFSSLSAATRLIIGFSSGFEVLRPLSWSQPAPIVKSTPSRSVGSSVSAWIESTDTRRSPNGKSDSTEERVYSTYIKVWR